MLVEELKKESNESKITLINAIKTGLVKLKKVILIPMELVTYSISVSRPCRVNCDKV